MLTTAARIPLATTVRRLMPPVTTFDLRVVDHVGAGECGLRRWPRTAGESIGRHGAGRRFVRRPPSPERGRAPTRPPPDAALASRPLSPWRLRHVAGEALEVDRGGAR